MKKKNIVLDKKLFFDKATLVELNKEAAAHVGAGGPAGTGTGCECVIKTCGIIACSAMPSCLLSIPPCC